MEFILLLALPCVVIYGALAVRTFGLFGLVLGMLLVGTVLGHPFFHVSVLTLDRLLLGMVIGSVILLRLYGNLPGERWDLTDLLVTLWIGWITLNTFTHDWKSNSGAPIATWLFFYAVPVVVYVAARYLRPNPQQLRVLMYSFAALGGYLSLTAAAECFGVHTLVFPKFIAEASYLEFLGRGRGPLLNPSGNGILITLGMVCAILLAKDLQRWRFCALTIVLGVFLLGIYSTLTRCVWLGGLGCLAVVAWLYLPSRVKWTATLAGCLVAICSAPIVLPYITKFKRDKNVSVEDMAESAKLRPMLAIIGWEIAKDHPLRGVGLGHYLEYSVDYAQNRNIDMPLELADKYVQHNIFLSILTENGAIGLILFLMMTGKWCHLAYQIWRYPFAPRESRYFVVILAGFGTAYLANGMFQDVLIIPMISTFAFFLAGLLRSLKANLAGQRMVLSRTLAYSPSTGLLSGQISTAS